MRLDAIVYDQQRQRLYLSNEDHNRVEIFDLTSKSYLPPISVGNLPTAIALTPDASLLAVANYSDHTVTVIDPGGSRVLATFSVVPAQNTGCNIPLSMASVTVHRMLVNMGCPNVFNGGTFHLLNLDTGSLSCVGVVGCDPNGTDMLFGSCCGLASTASVPDGTKVFLASQTQGTVALLDVNANTLAQGYQGTFIDAAANADGNTFASSFGIADVRMAQLSIMAYEPYADVGNQSLNNVFGEKLNPSGSLLFVPQKSGITIFDVHSGRLVQHIAVADGVPLDTNGMVLDETGTKIFAISNSGITITQLFQAPLSIGTLTPAVGAPGAKVQIRGSGFQNGVTVTFGNVQGSVVFTDQNTLTATVPAISAGAVRIAITNPSGHSYELDDAFVVQ